MTEPMVSNNSIDKHLPIANKLNQKYKIMSLIKSKPAFTAPSLFTDFFNDGFFDNELMNFPLTRWVPSANVSETDDEYIIRTIKSNLLSIINNNTFIVNYKSDLFEKYTSKNMTTKLVGFFSSVLQNSKNSSGN